MIAGRRWNSISLHICLILRYNQHHMHQARSQTMAMFITTCNLPILVPLTAQQPLLLHPTVFNLLERFRAGTGELASQTRFHDCRHRPCFEKESAANHNPICFTGIGKKNITVGFNFKFAGQHLHLGRDSNGTTITGIAASPLSNFLIVCRDL